MNGRGSRWVLLVVVLVGWVSACHREPPVATLFEAVGTVQRSEGAGWKDVAPGFGFVVGDTLRTAAASSARLRVRGGGLIRVGENGRLRFQRGGAPAQQAPDIVVDLGEAEIEETVAALLVITPAGSTRIQPGAHVRVRADDRGSTLEVIVGRALIMDAGREVALDAGQGVRIRIGSAEIERFEVKVGEAIMEGGPTARDAGTPLAEKPAQNPDASSPGTVAHRAAENPAENPADPSDTTREVRGDVGRADVTVAAGESATLHDGRPPLAVRLRFDGLCPGDAFVELGGNGQRRERLIGAGAVVVRLKPGPRPYRIHCAGDKSGDEPRAAGVLSLRRDTGDVPLPRHAPANIIEADGRRYTILFQTRLPRLTLAWPQAPATASGLQLHLESPAGERLLSVASPNRPVPAGTFQEGTYTWWYTAGEGKQSPKTTVTIRFDNAAPTAQFFRVSPEAKAAAPRGVISVDGVTVEGAKVSVGGNPLSLDGRGRFRADVAPESGDDAVAVRLELPRTGVHYYVRRRSDVR